MPQREIKAIITNITRSGKVLENLPSQAQNSKSLKQNSYHVCTCNKASVPPSKQHFWKIKAFSNSLPELVKLVMMALISPLGTPQAYGRTKMMKNDTFESLVPGTKYFRSRSIHRA
jgi:hypothetical protein